jgi:hypothetical protein
MVKSATGNPFIAVFNKFPATVLLLFLLLHSSKAFSQVDDYDEISVTLNVQRIGNIEIPAIIYKDAAYMPVKELFEFLKIKHAFSADLDSVSGFFIYPEAKFLIDKSKNRVYYANKIFDLKPTDLIRTETDLFLKLDYYSQIFELDCVFNFRSLSINMTTKLELPAIREMQIEMMHKNISKLKGEKKADTTIGRSYPLFRFGMADWAFLSTQEKDLNTTRVNLSLGAMLLGGEANVALSYDNRSAFDRRQQYYSWRYVNNDNTLLRQVTAGKIFVNSTSSVYAPVTGVQFTNTPTTYRKSFGTYTLSNTTEPGWTVELYVNNVLVNFTKADGSGFFTFQVPMVYGNSVVKLRFYSPWGEERFREQNVSVPFNFVPVNHLEYTITAGVVQDDEKAKYSRASFSYGLNRHITVGGGMEYLSTVTSGKSMPFINTSMRVGSNILLSGEHTHGVRTKGLFTYRLPSNFQVDLQYSKYDKVQTAVRFNYLEEKRLVVSLPLRGKHFSSYSRLTINQFKLPKTQFTSAELMISSIVRGVSSNLTTYMLLTDPVHPFVFSNLGLNIRLPKGIRFTPQIQYEYIQQNFSMLKVEVEKNVFNRGFLNVTWQKDLINSITSASLGFRYNFSFAQLASSVSSSNHINRTSVSAKGSLLYDDQTKYVGASNFNNVGKGGVVLLPFLDLNCNGKHEASEPRVEGLRLHVNGGRVQHNKKDTTITILGMEAYTTYYLELGNNSFDNIAWQLRKPVISVTVDPNHFKSIEIPVYVVGEASGTVMSDGARGRTGVGRIIVNIYDSSSRLVTKVLTEPDGFFSYMGLAPGKYTARIDQAQLDKIRMKCITGSQEFVINQNIDGDVVDRLKFVIAADNKSHE